MIPFDPTPIASRHNLYLDEPPADSSAFSLQGNELADRLAELINRFGENVNAPDRKTAGMLFFKRYSSLIAGAVYAWLHNRHPFDLSFSNIRYGLHGTNLKFFVLGAEPLPSIAGLPREVEQDEAYLRHLFHEHALAVIEAVANHTGVSRVGLWHTIAYLLAYWKQEWLLESASGTLSERIEQWFAYASRRSNPAWLPGRAVNPLACSFRKVEDPLKEGRQILIRKACCMNYRAGGDTDAYCYTCPLITDEHRIEKFMIRHSSD
ncbi:IucA/IucC family C-terminal-domain containing protein [Paenibacillus montanisoli]|uniref:Aerobactin siderophore biosynthesis IucA/IucC-like C-terminal domain-containing protein n=1 Tax=Paenibacillus montanisoli TaxID=2081970 RepID=A0A328U4M9_9BACL|nr:IucA/IucC family C-terminal-domain containing protein [Paenibacillus montanisoli]RAP77778.1 hypothetical protein DL346_04795 [Paenibacillus montanisoli]